MQFRNKIPVISFVRCKLGKGVWQSSLFSSSLGWLNACALCLVAQLCLTLCDPIDYTVHGILQARMLEWVAFPFSRGSSQSRDQTQVSLIAGGFFTSWATREAWLNAWHLPLISLQSWMYLPFQIITSCCYNTQTVCTGGKMQQNVRDGGGNTKIDCLQWFTIKVGAQVSPDHRLGLAFQINLRPPVFSIPLSWKERWWLLTLALGKLYFLLIQGVNSFSCGGNKNSLGELVSLLYPMGSPPKRAFGRKIFCP